jgi:chromosomal replication initiator protein
MPTTYAASLYQHYSEVHDRLWKAKPKPPPILPDPPPIITRQQIIATQCERERRRLCGKMIIREVARQFGMTYDDIRSDRKSHAYVIPRRIAIYLVQTILKRSKRDTAALIGKDPTTVLYATRKIAEQMALKPDLALEVERIHQRILAKAAS